MERFFLFSFLYVHIYILGQGLGRADFFPFSVYLRCNETLARHGLQNDCTVTNYIIRFPLFNFPLGVQAEHIFGLLVNLKKIYKNHGFRWRQT